MTNDNNLQLFDLRPATRYSYSMLATYIECPFRYKLTYLDKVTSSKKQKHYLMTGLTLHLVLQDFFGLERNKRTQEVMLSILDTRWGRWNIDQNQEESGYKQCEEIINRFFNTFPVGANVFERETGFKVKFQDSFLKGKIDRIDYLEDETFEIIDYKLGDEFGKTEKEIKDDLQWIFYWYAFKKKYEQLDYKPSMVSFYFLASSKKVSFRPTDIDENNALAKLQQQIQMIEEDKLFKKQKSANCNNCYFLERECV